MNDGKWFDLEGLDGEKEGEPQKENSHGSGLLRDLRNLHPTVSLQYLRVRSESQ